MIRAWRAFGRGWNKRDTMTSGLTNVFAPDLGVPQRRRRLIAIGLRMGPGGLLPDDLGAIVPNSLAARPPDAGDVIDLAGRIGGTNIRDMDTVDQMAHVVAGMVGRRLVYRDLTAEDGRSRVAT